MRPLAAITNELLDPSFPSDHVPVRAMLHGPSTRPFGRSKIPPWITAHPHFQQHTTLLLDEVTTVKRGA
eukprot:47046-Heterocapsa_arctica.AAC.1